MAYFDRFDICDAYYVFHREFHEGGDVPERPGIMLQLREMQYRPGFGVREYGADALSMNGREILLALLKRYAGSSMGPHRCSQRRRQWLRAREARVDIPI